MYILKLTLRNLFGAKLRTWLNAIVLSVSFILIIGTQSLYKGMSLNMENGAINSLYGGGQYWQNTYDPYDGLTLDDAHSRIPDELQTLLKNNQAVPILKRTATLYPNNRLVNITLNGIKPGQTVINIPTEKLYPVNNYEIPAVIGKRMAKDCNLQIGDTTMLRWRDIHGTFDAADIRIVEILNTDLGEIDSGQVWISIDKMRQITDMPDEATIIVLAKGAGSEISAVASWDFKNMDFLLADIRTYMLQEYTWGYIFYAIFLFLAMIGVFDTQILSIFRRKKEMGTMLALGLTKGDLIRIFTLEGVLNSILGGILAFLYGTPLLVWFGKVGWQMPEAIDEFGFSIGNVIYPVFTFGTIFWTPVIIIGITTLISYLPCRQIAKLTPTAALRGTAL